MGGCTSRPTEVDGPHPEAPPPETSVAPELEVKPVEGGDAPTEADAAKAKEPQLVDPATTIGEELKPEASAVVTEKPEDKEDTPPNEVAKESKEEKRSQVVDHPLAASSEGSKTS